MTTDTQRLARLEGAYEHLATKADLKDLELRLTAEIAELTRAMAAQTRWLAGLVLAAAAAGVVIAVDRLAG
ncbi:MAG: hypothetical protein OXG17_08745 [Chloroflexi bacterium]|nr:hypothetical protein [Chloroflexota bacterium]